MVHQPGYQEPACCFHHEPLIRGPEGQGCHISCPIQQVQIDIVYKLRGENRQLVIQCLKDVISWLTKIILCIRCVLNWFGDWSTEALYQVGKEFTCKMDLEKPNYKVPDYMPIVYDKLPQPPSHREAIVNGCVFVHQTLHQVCFQVDSGI